MAQIQRLGGPVPAGRGDWPVSTRTNGLCSPRCRTVWLDHVGGSLDDRPERTFTPFQAAARPPALSQLAWHTPRLTCDASG